MKKLEESRKVSANLRENEKYLRSRLENCSDILIRPMRLGDKHKVDCLMVYIEVAVSNMMLDDSALGKMINHFWEISPEDIQEFVRHNSLGIADVKKLENLDESIDAMLAGNAVFFIDGYDKAMKISSKGYPSTGVMEAESEKVLRGSRCLVLAIKTPSFLRDFLLVNSGGGGVINNVYHSVRLAGMVQKIRK